MLKQTNKRHKNSVYYVNRMDKKKLVSILSLLVFTMFFMSAVSALDSLGTYKQGETVRVTQVCSDATYINISSISYPNSTTAVSNIEMTSAGSGEYYYEFNQTSDLGRFDVRGISDGCENTFATYFTVTQSGEGNEQTLYLIFITIAGLLGLVLFIFSFIYDDKLFIFSAIGFFTSGIMVLYFPFGNESQFIQNSVSILLNGLGMIIIGVYVIKDWFNA